MGLGVLACFQHVQREGRLLEKGWEPLRSYTDHGHFLFHFLCQSGSEQNYIQLQPLSAMEKEEEVRGQWWAGRPSWRIWFHLFIFLAILSFHF